MNVEKEIDIEIMSGVRWWIGRHAKKGQKTRLSQTFVHFSQNASFVKHLSLISMLVIVGDLLAQVPR